MSKIRRILEKMKPYISRTARYMGKISLFVVLFYTFKMFMEGQKYEDLWLGLFSTNLIEIYAGKIYLFLMLALLFAVLGDIYESNK